MDGHALVGELHDWYGQYVTVIDPGVDIPLIVFWTLHTHVAVETYTTPRLLIDSPVPGSGKTTLLEHLNHLCLTPVQAASLSSPALLARMLHAVEPSTRTILIDEADRSLSPDNPMTGELLAVLNSGYKRGGSRPVLVQRGNEWVAVEMPTYAPVAMAGNAPNLPDDTRSRCIRVMLMPDTQGIAEESDWEVIEDEATVLHDRIVRWADQCRDEVKVNRPEMPQGVRGRDRERWAPLKRVAVAIGGDWPGVIDALALADIERMEIEREDGIVQNRPHMVLIEHLSELFTDAGVRFLPTDTIVSDLIRKHPTMWGNESPYGKKLTVQRMGRMLSQHFNITSVRKPDGDRERGYTSASLRPVFDRFVRRGDS